MTDFQDALSKILSSPEDMVKIASIAKSFGLGAGADDGAQATAGRTEHEQNGDKPGSVNITPESIQSAVSGLDPGMMGKLMGLVQAYNGKSDKAALIDALSPYLKTEQRGKLARAVEAAKLARVAKAAFGDMGIQTKAGERG